MFAQWYFAAMRDDAIAGRYQHVVSVLARETQLSIDLSPGTRANWEWANVPEERLVVGWLVANGKFIMSVIDVIYL